MEGFLNIETALENYEAKPYWIVSMSPGVFQHYSSTYSNYPLQIRMDLVFPDDNAHNYHWIIYDPISGKEREKREKRGDYSFKYINY